MEVGTSVSCAEILPAENEGLRQFRPSARDAAEAAEALWDGGFQPPTWDELLRLDPRSQGKDFGDYTRGWQRAAGMVPDAADEAGLLADLDPASRALLLSQAGDHAGTKPRHVACRVPHSRLPLIQANVAVPFKLVAESAVQISNPVRLVDHSACVADIKGSPCSACCGFLARGGRCNPLQQHAQAARLGGGGPGSTLRCSTQSCGPHAAFPASTVQALQSLAYMARASAPPRPKKSAGCRYGLAEGRGAVLA